MSSFNPLKYLIFFYKIPSFLQIIKFYFNFLIPYNIIIPFSEKLIFHKESIFLFLLLQLFHFIFIKNQTAKYFYLQRVSLILPKLF